MASQYDRLVEILFSYFNFDYSKFLLPRLPYYDDFNCRRIIDYAIVSKDPSMPRVAILVRPPEASRSKLQNFALEDAVQALQLQNWITLIFSEEDIKVRSAYIREQLENIFVQKHHPAVSQAPKAGLSIWLRKAPGKPVKTLSLVHS